MQNLTEISNNELLDLYTIGNTLTRGWLARGLESDKAAMREYRKEIKRRGFARIADFRAACAAERRAEQEAELAAARAAQATEDAAEDVTEAEESQDAEQTEQDAAEADRVLAEAANASEVHPGLYELADNAGVTMEDVEEFMYAIVYRLKKAGNMPDEESVLAAMDDHQRDMETEYLNALLQL